MLNVWHCHKLQKLEKTDNIILIFQPARSSEFNLIERVGEHLKIFLRWGWFITLKELRAKVRKILTILLRK